MKLKGGISAAVLVAMTLFLFISSGVAHAQIDFRPNMYHRFKNSSNTYRQSYTNAQSTIEGQSTQSFSVQPIGIKQGDMVRVVTDTNLQRGADTLTKVSAGETHKVLRVMGNWVGIGTKADGKEVRGWVDFRTLEVAN